MPEPPQLTLVEPQLDTELPRDESRHTLEKTSCSRLHPGFCSSSHDLYRMTIGDGWSVSKLIHLSFSSAPSSLQQTMASQTKARPVDLSKILEPLHLSQSLTFNPEGAFNLFRSRITPSYLQEPTLIPVTLHLTVKFPSAG